MCLDEEKIVGKNVAPSFLLFFLHQTSIAHTGETAGDGAKVHRSNFVEHSIFYEKAFGSIFPFPVVQA